GLAPREEAEVSAVIGGQYPEVWISPESGMIVVNLERYQWIVLGLHQQRGNSNPFQILPGGLALVIVLRRAKAEATRGEEVVEIPNGLRFRKVFQPEQPRRKSSLAADAVFQATEKTVFV